MQKSICDRHIIEGEPILICVHWGQQGVECVKRLCCGCGRELAMAKETIPIERDGGLKPTCILCAIRLNVEGQIYFGGVIYKGRVVIPGIYTGYKNEEDS